MSDLLAHTLLSAILHMSWYLLVPTVVFLAGTGWMAYKSVHRNEAAGLWAGLIVGLAVLAIAAPSATDRLGILDFISIAQKVIG